MYLSVIIPAYNEAERIPKTLIDIDKHLSRVDFTYEIVVVNDGSTDNTAEIVKKMTASIKNLKLLDNKENHGKGAVVRDGMLLTKGEIRLFTDADNSTSIDQFEKMIPLFKEGYDVVIGSRAIKGSKLTPSQPFYRRALGRLSNLIIQLVNTPGIHDTQCGFKAFTAKAAEEIFTRSKIVGWGFDIEALALARALGFRIKEIPVTWVNDLASHVRASAYLQVFKENIMIRLWLSKDVYNVKSKKENGKS